MKTILFLDAGFRHTGYAVWDLRLKKFVDYGTVDTQRTPKKKRQSVTGDNARSCMTIFHGLRTIIRRFNPECVVAELPVGGSKSFHAAAGMSFAVATVSCVTAAAGLGLYVVKPLEIKRVIKAKGEVSKDEVIAWINRRFCLDLRGSKAEHIADACMCYVVCKKKYPEILCGGTSLK